MLYLSRAGGQWTEITHRGSGAAIRVCVMGIKGGRGNHPGKVVLLFDDDPGDFAVLRDEAKVRSPGEGNGRA